MTHIKNHIGLVLLVDYKNCNPQGSPAHENAPRVDDETLKGLITAPGLRRKVRDYFASLGRDIYVGRGVCYETQNQPLFNKVGAAVVTDDDTDDDTDSQADVEPTPKKGKKGKKVAKKGKGCSAAQAMDVYRALTERYIDARLFGQLVPGIPGTCRGPIQISMGESIDPVSPQRMLITRCAVATEKEANDQNDANRMLGGLHFIPYGLYRFHIYVNPNDAKKTSCTEEDYALFIEAIKSMFDNDRSSARTQVCVRALYEFRMNAQMAGAVNIERLLESVSVTRKNTDVAARSFADYTIEIPRVVQNHPDVDFHRLVSEVSAWVDAADSTA